MITRYLILDQMKQEEKRFTRKYFIQLLGNDKFKYRYLGCTQYRLKQSLYLIQEGRVKRGARLRRKTAFSVRVYCHLCQQSILSTVTGLKSASFLFNSFLLASFSCKLISLNLSNMGFNEVVFFSLLNKPMILNIS